MLQCMDTRREVFLVSCLEIGREERPLGYAGEGRLVSGSKAQTSSAQCWPNRTRECGPKSRWQNVIHDRHALSRRDDAFRCPNPAVYIVSARDFCSECQLFA